MANQPNNEIFQTRNVQVFRNFFKNMPVSDFAAELEKLPLEKKIFYFRLLQTNDAAEVFSYLHVNTQEELILSFTSKELKAVINDLYLDEIVDLVEEVPAELSRKILNSISDKEDRQQINKLLTYKDYEVGSIMSVDIVVLKDSWNCKKALDFIRSKKEIAEFSEYFFVTNRQDFLVGAISLSELVFSDEKTLIADICFAVATIKTRDSKEEASQIFANQDLSTLPVLNHVNNLVGMVTSDDVIDVLISEATEDVYKMAGISSKATETTYLQSSVWKIVKSRIFWLIILMIGSTLSQIIIEGFQNSINQNFKNVIGPYVLISLVSIIPVISGTAGNAGSQSASTVTRSLALREINFQNLKTIVWKETKVGLVIGLIIGIINFLRLVLFFLINGNLLLSESEVQALNLGMSASQVVQKFWLVSLSGGVAIFLVVLLSKVIGATIPLLVYKMKKDPAVISSPALSTLTDATANLLFFGISVLIMVYVF